MIAQATFDVSLEFGLNRFIDDDVWPTGDWFRQTPPTLAHFEKKGSGLFEIKDWSSLKWTSRGKRFEEILVQIGVLNSDGTFGSREMTGFISQRMHAIVYGEFSWVATVNFPLNTEELPWYRPSVEHFETGCCANCGCHLEGLLLDTPYWCENCATLANFLTGGVGGINVSMRIADAIEGGMGLPKYHRAMEIAVRTDYLVDQALQAGQYESAEDIEKRGNLAEIYQLWLADNS